MALQGNVGQVPAIGTPGQEVVAGQAAFLSFQVLSDGTVTPGGFVFGKAGTGTGESFAVGSATGEADAVPVGLAVRIVDGMITNVLDSYASQYAAGEPVTVAVRGQIYAAVPADATANDGDKVLIDPETGEISFGAGAGEGQVDTGWTARGPNGAASVVSGEIVILERY